MQRCEARAKKAAEMIIKGGYFPLKPEGEPLKRSELVSSREQQPWSGILVVRGCQEELNTNECGSRTVL